MDSMIFDLLSYDIHLVDDLSDDWLRLTVFGDADSVSPCAEELAEFFMRMCDEDGMEYDQFDRVEQFQDYVQETAEAFIQQWRSRLIAAHPSLHGVTVAL